MRKQSFSAVVIGASAGGIEALNVLFSGLQSTFPVPVFVVKHIDAEADDSIVRYLDKSSCLPVTFADDQEPVENGHIYLAPPGYHMLIEEDCSISLCVDRKVTYSRPSVDVLFESAAEAYGSHLIGVVLTGANRDGSAGARLIKQQGGIVLVQDPATAEHEVMPKATLADTDVDGVMALPALAARLNELTGQ
ncbi:chemotaxis protein CheB [Kistimonas asteriae]|uniref:chemotaxis protein CheB n=1 Tax=Kistimonas asteriae TaxID=517724 RepID=UPI001BA8212C|nr:chemotaxis protein CheB [Kistimonas asteriae]